MRYFLDTEFIESGPNKPIYLISIGLVSDDGRSFYAINADCPFELANDWVKENVYPNLNKTRENIISADQIAQEVLDFIGKEKPEFWGYYADYDWVVFCQMFGAMINLPKGWPMYCNDIKQYSKQLGDIQLPKQISTEHNALSDALWNKEAFHFLENRLAMSGR